MPAAFYMIFHLIWHNRYFLKRKQAHRLRSQWGSRESNMVTHVCLTPTPIAFPTYTGDLHFIPGGRVQYTSLHSRLYSVVYKALKQKWHAPGCRIATPSEVLWNTVPNKLKSEKFRWNLWSCRKGVLHCLWIGHSQRQSHLRDGGNHRKQWLLKNTLAAKNLIPILWKSAVVPSVIHQPSAFLEVVKLERVAFVQMNKHHRDESMGLSWVGLMWSDI